VFQALKELLFPPHCFGCNALGIEICTNCRKYWNSHLYVQKIQNLTIYSSIRYSSVAKSILLAAKESSLQIADELIIDAVVDCIHRLPSQSLRSAILMPVPGSKRAIRKRGRDFISAITQEVSLRTGIPMANGMIVSRRLLDQSGLSASDRKRNIHEAFRYSGDFQKREILLIDDLVTTGSTLLEAKRALNAEGIAVNLAITACVAQTLNI
jgi:predicted amidophosphoribosyltransferase